MRAKRKIVLRICIFFLTILAVVWFALHFAAPNPTHRWYSTEVLDVSRNTTNEQKGIQGEDLLALDLGLEEPTNERSDNAICVCGIHYSGEPSPRGCSSCFVYSADISNYRIPDFVTRSYIAESKNRISLLASDSDTIVQVTEMAAGARAFGIPLYIYVRINTVVDREYYEIARSTGGDVVHYFLVDGYESLIIFEAMINGLLIIIVLLSLGAGVWVYIMNNRPGNPSEDSIDEIDKAEDSINETEEFMKRMERLSKKSKDEDDKKGKK